jgi:hypothetical protein
MSTRSLVVKSLQFLTADLHNAGMGSGLFGFKALAGGQFYLTACGPIGCCQTGHLDNKEGNWHRGKVTLNRVRTNRASENTMREYREYGGNT